MSAAMHDEDPVEVVGRHLDAAPVDLDHLARDLGLTVSYEPLPGEVAGKIEKARDGGYRITVNSLDHPRRRRFTLAHECAHFVLHRDLIGDGIVDEALYRSKLSDTIERQANRYAADLLMPAALMKREWRSGARSYVDFARKFDVSPEAASIRLKDLGFAP